MCQGILVVTYMPGNVMKGSKRSIYESPSRVLEEHRIPKVVVGIHAEYHVQTYSNPIFATFRPF